MGSITHITNSSGSVVQELSYDAWGQLRNPTNQAVYAPGAAPELFLGRGYTGHEHLAMFGLVNMNARLYDPALGRFLSPDPYVQSPDFSQNFNRYSYCMNNPFKYTDPSGKDPFLIGLAIYAGFMYLYNAFANTSKNKDSGNPGNWTWNPEKWNSSVVANVGYNTGGNWTFSGGVGNPNNPIPVFGYNTQYGAGVGMNNNGSLNMYYPGYENKVNNAMSQNISNAINNAQQGNFTSGLFAVAGANLYAYGSMQQYNAMDLVVSLESGAGTWNPAHAAAYERELLNAKVGSLKAAYAGKALGIANAGYIYYQYDSRQISFSQMLMEEGSNAFVTFAKGARGIYWSLGWEVGRLYTTYSYGYQEMKFNFWRNRMESIYGPPSDSNRYLWEEYYREYFK